MANTVYPTIAAAVANAQQTAVAPLSWNPVDHLLSRFSFGWSVADRAAVNAAGYDGWYQAQVGYATTLKGYRGNSAVAAVGPLLAMSPFDLSQWLIGQNNQYGWTAMEQLSQVTLGLQAWSSAQLYETLVDFFANVLNVANYSDGVYLTRHTFDRDVIRANATGTYTNMLLAAAKNPAMLTYLNLAESTKAAVNENYGRELLELHTVGRIYSESDVKNTAKLLTGRTLDQYQHYLYDEYIHGTGTVKVLGFTNANSDPAKGEAAGDSLLKYLASHPATATNLAQKMCVRYVSDTPSAGLVAAVAQAYLDNKTAILPMVSTILRSTEFWESRGQKVRRPTENLMATIRALGITATDMPTALSTVEWMTRQMSNLPLAWPAPNGYPDVATAWRSAANLLDEWQMHMSFVAGWNTCLTTPNIPAMYGSAVTLGDAVASLASALTGSPWQAADLTSLIGVIAQSPLTLLTKSSLTWLYTPLAALALHSPYHALR